MCVYAADQPRQPEPVTTNCVCVCVCEMDGFSMMKWFKPAEIRCVNSWAQGVKMGKVADTQKKNPKQVFVKFLSKPTYTSKDLKICICYKILCNNYNFYKQSYRGGDRPQINFSGLCW